SKRVLKLRDRRKSRQQTRGVEQTRILSRRRYGDQHAVQHRASAIRVLQPQTRAKDHRDKADRARLLDRAEDRHLPYGERGGRTRAFIKERAAVNRRAKGGNSPSASARTMPDDVRRRRERRDKDASCDETDRRSRAARAYRLHCDNRPRTP